MTKRTTSGSRARKTLFPSGVGAANLLGFSTQAAGRSEIATSALSLPRKLVGAETVIHTRRPEAWAKLSEEDAALLDFLFDFGMLKGLPCAGRWQAKERRRLEPDSAVL